MEASAAPVRDPVRVVVRAIGGLWWLWLAFGIFWIVVALVVLQFDRASVRTVGVLIGVMFLLSGLQQLFISRFAIALRGGSWPASPRCPWSPL